MNDFDSDTSSEEYDMDAFIEHVKLCMVDEREFQCFYELCASTEYYDDDSNIWRNELIDICNLDPKEYCR